MKPWLKLSSLAATLALLAACSSGLQTDAPNPVEESLLSTQATTVSYQVPDSVSDAEESDGFYYSNSPVLELGEKVDKPQQTGLRFVNVNVPKNARITSAYLEFTSAKNLSNSASLKIYGFKASNVFDFGPRNSKISTRTKTNAVTTWNPGDWTSGGTYRSESLTSVVKEITNLSGWSAGNAMGFVVTGTIGTRSALSFDGNSANAPKLVVSYETSSNSEIDIWQDRLEYSFTHSISTFDPKKIAASGDLYMLGRFLNFPVTGLSNAYRINRDPDTATYLKQVMDIAYSKLRDTDGDGYRNWIYLRGGTSVASCKELEPANAKFCGKDTFEMEEMMTHAMAAAAAYTLKQAGYNVDNWVNYLRNDFEAKWRKRTNKPTGFPLLTKLLAHPYFQFTRYSLYMYKLTGDRAYYNEAARLTKNINIHVIDAYAYGATYAHRVVEGKPSRANECTPTVYVPIAVQALQDISVAAPELLSDALMKKIAYSVRTKVLANSNDGSTVRSLCGRDPKGDDRLATFPFGAVAAWDSTGSIETKQRAAYQALASRSKYTVNSPAMMILSLGLDK